MKFQPIKTRYPFNIATRCLIGFVCAISLLSGLTGCNQHRYQPAEFRTTSSGTTLPNKDGSFRMGSSLPGRNWQGSTLPGSTLPGRGFRMGTLPGRGYPMGTLPNRGSYPAGGTTLPGRGGFLFNGSTLPGSAYRESGYGNGTTLPN